MEKKLQRSAGLLLSALGAAILCFRNLITEELYQMEFKDWVNVAVTVSGFLIAFWGIIFGAIILLKRDSKTIDGISSNTIDMKPHVESIKDSIQTVVPAISTDIQPKINNIDHRTEKQSEKIDAIAKEIEVFKQLKSETAGSTVRPEILLASITQVLEDNAQLRIQHREDQQKILALNVENQRLQLENQKLEIALDRQSPTHSHRGKDYELEL